MQGGRAARPLAGNCVWGWPFPVVPLADLCCGLSKQCPLIRNKRRALEVQVEQDVASQGTSQPSHHNHENDKTTCSGLDAAVDTPGKGGAGLTKLALVFALAVSPLLLARPTAAVDTLPILWEAGGRAQGTMARARQRAWRST